MAKANNKNLMIEVDNDTFFEDDLLSYYSVSCTEEELVYSGVLLRLDYETEKEFIARIVGKLDALKELPKVNEVSYPLNKILQDHYNSTYGMLFYDNDESFPFSKEDLDKLDKQIKKYHLEYVIEINPDAAKLDPIITCYMSLSSLFNFVPTEEES